MSVVWQTDTPTHVAKLVLLALADNANDEGVCWPSITTLARKCCLSRQAVLDQIAILLGGKREKVRHGGIGKEGGTRYLEIIGRGQGGSNKYRILPVKPVDQLLVKPLDQSSPLTSQAQTLPVVKPLDYPQSSPDGKVVKPIDWNHHKPSVQPSIEPPLASRVQKLVERIKPTSLWEMKTVVEKKELLMKEIKDQYSSEVAWGTQWNNEEQRQRCIALKKEIKTLNERMAGIA